MKNKKITLAYITPQYSPEFGGPWHNLFLELSKYVKVYCIAQPKVFSKDKRERIDINDNLTVLRFKEKRFRLRRELMVPTNLDKILNKLNPDIVQSDEFFRFTTHQAARWANKNKKPFILNSRMKERFGLIRNIFIWLFSKFPSSIFSVKYASKIISTQGDCSKKEFLKWYPKTESKFVIIPSGIDIQRFRGKSIGKVPFPGKKVILNISRIDSMKRLDILIDCFEEINKKIPNSLLVHVGPKNDENEWKKIQKRIKEKKLSKKIKFIGPVNNSDSKKFYNSADVFVNTSVGEGIAFAFLEAMTFKVPIVAFDQGGNYCSITNNKNGFLIKEDNKSLFVERVSEILKDKKLRKKLSDGAWKRVNSEFDIKKNAKKYVDVYQEILDRNFPNNPK